ncbi:hypothetical protein [Microscilla marina]|uniref:hypothetical protein n=1 Tax=Microscilla marina TaxID=1027 RepID=UPI0018DC6D9E|nr:hypothetical protein [Microscilla marina]
MTNGDKPWYFNLKNDHQNHKLYNKNILLTRQERNLVMFTFHIKDGCYAALKFGEGG